MSEELKPLSASRIKCYQSCSWMFWCKYHLKVPDKSNDGASRGSVCHLIFESLGNPRHRKHYDLIVKKRNVYASAAVKRLLLNHANKLGVNDYENIQLIKTMILNGLLYDFFGHKRGTPDQDTTEEKFDISVDEDGKKYRILGFIDRLFLYKKQCLAVIRDFKSSKQVFSGKDIEDNLQDQMYSLAVSKLYPEFLKRQTEFLFIKFPLEGKGTVVADGLSNDELEGFEYMLTEIQKSVENFSEENSKQKLAYYDSFPTDKSFSGRLLCGFDEYEGQLKKDGTVRWGCSFKWPFEYYQVYDKNGKLKNSFRMEEAHLIDYDNDDNIVLAKYEGCPAWN